MRRMNFSWAATFAVGLVAVAFVATACGDDPPPPPPPAARAPTPPPKPEPAKAEVAVEDSVEVEYTYSPIGKRDPFRSLVEEQAPVEVPIVSASSCGPLCDWELDQLRVVAVVSGVASPVAMVEDPRGNGHVLKRGMSIGKRSGRITDIRRDHLVVTELMRGPEGQVIPAKSEMPLRAKGAEQSAQAVDLTPQDSNE